jgi:hypothetical protein
MQDKKSLKHRYSPYDERKQKDKAGITQPLLRYCSSSFHRLVPCVANVVKYDQNAKAAKKHATWNNR